MQHTKPSDSRRNFPKRSLRSENSNYFEYEYYILKIISMFFSNVCTVNITASFYGNNYFKKRRVK